MDLRRQLTTGLLVALLASSGLACEQEDTGDDAVQDGATEDGGGLYD